METFRFVVSLIGLGCSIFLTVTIIQVFARDHGYLKSSMGFLAVVGVFMALLRGARYLLSGS